MIYIMNGSNDDDDDNFRRLLEPGPSFKLHGGKRHMVQAESTNTRKVMTRHVLLYGERFRCTRMFTTNG